MQQVWIVAYITIFAMVAHAYAQDLHVSVIPKSLRFTAKQSVQVTIKYKNNGPNPVLIYKWGLPDGQIFHSLFKIVQNGKSVGYVGPLVKRKPPTKEDAISLDPGKEISALADLSQAYDMSISGNYDVQFDMNVKFLLHTSSSDSEIEKTSSTAADASVLQSKPATLFIEGRRNALIDENVQKDKLGKSVTPTYVGCSTARQSSIAASIQGAITYSAGSLNHLATLTSKASTRYTTWFGMYSSSNLATLKRHYTNINTVLNTKLMVFDCTCTMANVYAYVYANLPYKIYLCPFFWSGPLTGIDSKAGTLVHEISHFTVVANTDDHAYGQSSCKALAKKNPTLAVNNADSHQYFAENNPILN